jgi:tetratricopeptide (TPR) repeat protein
MSAPSLQEAFRRLQAGDAAGALEIARAIAAAEPRNARAALAAGIALRALGRFEESRAALEQAGGLAPGDAAPAFELGVLCEALGRAEESIAHYERALSLRPAFGAAHVAAGLQRYRRGEWTRAAKHFGAVAAVEPRNVAALVNLGLALGEQGLHEESRAAMERAIEADPADASARHAIGWLMDRMGRAPEAMARYEEALARDPRHFASLRALGRRCAARGDYGRAADLFRAAATLAPADPDLPLYVAQALLLLGRWREAWEPWYARRDSRVAFEAAAAKSGRPYRVPRGAELAGANVALVGEQGLGDILFFLRFAPRLRGIVKRLAFAGDPRLHPILARTGLFDALSSAPAADDVPILVADLPLTLDLREDVFAPSLRVSPDASRIEALRERLAAAGPRPWTAATWRSGTPRERSRQALSKEIAVAPLFGALARLPGTVFAFQRGARADELAAAAEALGRPVHDLSDVAEDLEDALAIAALVDRHVAVSSTNVHLAALAGAAVEVLVPFPPEWRSRPEGDSPWFPGFAMLRQRPDGGWDEALAQIRSQERMGSG